MKISRKRLHEAMLEQGMHAGNTDAKFDQPRAPRRYIVSDGLCVTCSQHTPGGRMMPPHDASRMCESGKRNHCSCDICF